MSIELPPPASPLTIYTDASTSHGIGVVIDNKYLAWSLIGGWKADGRDIGWAEVIAVEMAVIWLAHRGVRNASVTILCDNQGVVLGWSAGRSRNMHQNSTIACIAALSASLGIRVSLSYVNTKDNLADAPSRNVTPPGITLAHDPPAIPEHLAEFISPPPIKRI
jgi:hypothetical protein